MEGSSGQADEASEYGSDFTLDEEEILNGLLQVQSVPESADNPITNSELHLQDTEEDEGSRGIRPPVCLQYASRSSRQRSELQMANKRSHEHLNHHIEVSTNFESATSRVERETSASIEAPLDPVPEVPDLRSPLERFRTKPKKALSVTDLVSPSWCELQYWYMLIKFGKKPRTHAMRQGSKVHKALEDQVHVMVQVDIKTNEDNWGLRIWNVIQGLRTLRETGMTRELAIWGVLDGQVVSGIIDELAYVCPDRELEAAAEEQQNSSSKKTTALPPDQATLTDFLKPRGTLQSIGGSFVGALQPSRSNFKAGEPSPRIYISDIKTRGVRSLPGDASFKPTLMQLLLYHRLLAELATGQVDSDLLFKRYDLDANLPFTDSFIAQIGNLNQDNWPEELNCDSPSMQDTPASSQDSMTTLLTHNSVSALWGFMIEEFRTTFPLGAKSLGSVLKAEYRDASTGDIMGSKAILYERDTLDKYLRDEMEWWRGERSARGVSVEEAYKCGSCDFAEGCEWRVNKIDEHVKHMRSRSKV